MKYKIEFLAKLTYFFYIIAIIFNIYVAITIKDFDKLHIAIWIFNCATMFNLYRRADKFGDERVEWRDKHIDRLTNFNNRLIKQLDDVVEIIQAEKKIKDEEKQREADKFYCIHYKSQKPEILYISRNLNAEKFVKIEEAKKIASDIIGCEYVDGKNLEINGEYVAGVYIDDIEMMSQRHEMVIINEIDGLDRATCEKIIEYLKEDNDFTKELKDYDLI